jgi:hypothetical protein
MKNWMPDRLLLSLDRERINSCEHGASLDVSGAACLYGFATDDIWVGFLVLPWMWRGITHVVFWCMLYLLIYLSPLGIRYVPFRRLEHASHDTGSISPRDEIGDEDH